MGYSEEEIKKFKEQFDIYGGDLKTEQLQALVDVGEIEPEDMYISMDWEADVEIIDVKPNKVIFDSLIFGYTAYEKFDEDDFDYDKHFYYKIPTVAKIAVDGEVTLIFDDSVLTKQQKKMWKGSRWFLEDYQLDNFKENYKYYITEARKLAGITKADE